MLARVPRWQLLLIVASAILTASGLVLLIVGPWALAFALLAFAQSVNIAIGWRARNGRPNFLDPQHRPR